MIETLALTHWGDKPDTTVEVEYREIAHFYSNTDTHAVVDMLGYSSGQRVKRA